MSEACQTDSARTTQQQYGSLFARTQHGARVGACAWWCRRVLQLERQAVWQCRAGSRSRRRRRRRQRAAAARGHAGVVAVSPMPVASAAAGARRSWRLASKPRSEPSAELRRRDPRRGCAPGGIDHIGARLLALADPLADSRRSRWLRLRRGLRSSIPSRLGEHAGRVHERVLLRTAEEKRALLQRSRALRQRLGLRASKISTCHRCGAGGARQTRRTGSASSSCCSSSSADSARCRYAANAAWRRCQAAPCDPPAAPAGVCSAVLAGPHEGAPPLPGKANCASGAVGTGVAGTVRFSDAVWPAQERREKGDLSASAAWRAGPLGAAAGRRARGAVLQNRPDRCRTAAHLCRSAGQPSRRGSRPRLAAPPPAPSRRPCCLVCPTRPETASSCAARRDRAANALGRALRSCQRASGRVGGQQTEGQRTTAAPVSARQQHAAAVAACGGVVFAARGARRERLRRLPCCRSC